MKKRPKIWLYKSSKRIWTVCLVLFFFSFGKPTLFAQDIHFSQIASSKLNLNPAETGDFKADHRFTANYRNQWATVTVPYKTISASYENKQTQWLKNFANIGIGLLFNSDIAGDGNMGTVHIKLSSALHCKPIFEKSLFMSFGVNLAYNQHSLDYSRLIFDSQYNGIQFDPAMQNNEIFSSEQLRFIDISLGSKFMYMTEAKIPIFLGIVFNHINNTKQSFTNLKNKAINGKFNSYLGTEIPLFNNNWSMKPLVYFYKQGTFYELYGGTIMQKKLEHIDFRSFSLGMFNRAGDSFIFRLGLEYQTFNFGFSYDLNYSSLRVASRGIGAFEFSIIYLMHNPIKYENRINQQCPVFL